MSMDSNLNNIPFLVKSESGYIVLRIFLQPNAKKTECIGIHGNALRIRIMEPAIDNKANNALLLFISEYCGLKKNTVHLLSGETNRIKTIALHGDTDRLVLFWNKKIEEWK